MSDGIERLLRDPRLATQRYAARKGGIEVTISTTNPLRFHRRSDVQQKILIQLDTHRSVCAHSIDQVPTKTPI